MWKCLPNFFHILMCFMFLILMCSKKKKQCVNRDFSRASRNALRIFIFNHIHTSHAKPFTNKLRSRMYMQSILFLYIHRLSAFVNSYVRSGLLPWYKTVTFTLLNERTTIKQTKTTNYPYCFSYFAYVIDSVFDLISHLPPNGLLHIVI